MKGRITQLGHWEQGRSRTALGYSPVGGQRALPAFDSEQFRPAPGTCHRVGGRLKPAANRLSTGFGCLYHDRREEAWDGGSPWSA